MTQWGHLSKYSRFTSWNWFQSSYSRTDMLKLDEMWRRRRRQRPGYIWVSSELTAVWDNLLCQTWHSAVSTLARSLLPRGFSPNLENHLPYSPHYPLLTVCSQVIVLTQPTQSPEGEVQNLLTHCYSSFSRNMTTAQDIRAWHFPHLGQDAENEILSPSWYDKSDAIVCVLQQASGTALSVLMWYRVTSILRPQLSASHFSSFSIQTVMQKCECN